MKNYKFIGLKWVKGYKNYNAPFERVTTHPTLVFESNEHYYFINLSSLNEEALRDVLRNNKNTPMVFTACDVIREERMFRTYQMNLMTLVARCDKETVTDKFKYGSTRVEIKGNYKCSNYKELINILFKIIKNNLWQFYIYNGNDDNYQYKELPNNETFFPDEFKECLK